MKINRLDKIIFFIFPRWGLKRIIIREQLQKPQGSAAGLPQAPRSTEKWLKLSRHKDDKKNILSGFQKPGDRENFQTTLGLNCEAEAKKKWIM